MLLYLSKLELKIGKTKGANNFLTDLFMSAIVLPFPMRNGQAILGIGIFPLKKRHKQLESSDRQPLR
jgi:hypothetical protein